jgi:sporulation integral membrane protein YtvI
MGKKTGISQKFWGVVLFFLLLLLIFFSLFFAVDRLVGELLRLAESVSSDGGGIGDAFEQVRDYVTNLTSRLPIIKDVRENAGGEEFWNGIDAALADSIRSGMTELSSSVPKIVARVAASLPEIFLFLTVSIITGFFFACGGVDVFSFCKLLPKKWAQRLDMIKKRAGEAVVSWFRAYLLILGLTFFELFIGFSMLGVNYSFLAAFGVALVDILPMFGAGAVLVPWAAVMLITGNQFMGVGLLVLWAIVSVIRQFAEPKIIGRSFGVSPLLTLLAMYSGLRLFGIAGMIVAPAALMVGEALLFREAK